MAGVLHALRNLRLALIICISLAQFSVCSESCGESQNILGHYVQLRCPPFADDEKMFCCLRPDGSGYCCDSLTLMKDAGFGVLITVIVGFLIGITIVCCVCCLCCPCCLLYKRRHRGTVYGPGVETIAVQSQVAANAYPVQPQTGPNYQMVQQPPQPPYPMAGAPTYNMPMGPPGVAAYPPAPGFQVQQELPPPYSLATANDAYAKQAPYNPTF